MPSDWLEWQRWRDWWRDFTSSIVRAEGAQATDRQLAITYALTLLLSWDLRYMLAELSRPGAVLPNLVAISPSLNQDIRRGNAAISALEKERAERTPAGSLEWTKFIDPKLEGLPEKPYEQLKRLLKPRIRQKDSDLADLRAEGEAEAIAEYRQLRGPELPADREHLLFNLAQQIWTLMQYDPAKPANRGICAAKYERAKEQRAKQAAREQLEETRTSFGRRVSAESDSWLPPTSPIGNKSDAAKVLRSLKKMLGAKRVTFLQAYSTTKSVPAAAKIAGISESSGWRALAKARKHGKFLRSIENI